MRKSVQLSKFWVSVLGQDFAKKIRDDFEKL